MASQASGLNVKVSADVAQFTRDMGRATHEVSQFARRTKDIAQSLGLFSSSSTSAAFGLQQFAAAMPASAAGARQLVTSVASVAQGLATTTGVMATTVLVSGQLSKAFATVSAASKLAGLGSVAATLGPVTIAIAATGAAVWALSKAFEGASKTSEQLVSHVTRVQDVSFRVMPTSEMTGRRAHEVEGVTVSGAPDVSAVTAFTLAVNQTKIAVDEWKDAVAGVRPVTAAVASDWQAAMTFVAQALAHTTGLTKDQITQLYRLRDALREVQTTAPPLSPGDARNLIRPIEAVGGRTPLQKDIDGQSFARRMLGDRMDAKPRDFGTEGTNRMTQAFTAGWQSVKSAIVDQLPLRLSMLITGKTPAGAVGGAVGAAFGTGVGNAIGSNLGKGVGAAIGSAVLPIVGSLAGAFLGSKIGDLFGHHRKATDESASALARLAQQAERVSEAISNLPVGIKIARARFQAADPETPPPLVPPPYYPSDPSAPTSPTTPNAASVVFTGPVTIVADDPKGLFRQINAIVNRGGASDLSLAAARAGARR
jgi:hypothetical protein